MQVSRLLRRSLQRLRDICALTAQRSESSSSLECSASASPACGAARALLAGRVLEDPPRGVLVPVAGVLDQGLLGLLEAFGLALAGLDQRDLGGVDLLAVLDVGLGATAAADPRRLRSRLVLLLAFEVGS